jgi:hypothetical protein
MPSADPTRAPRPRHVASPRPANTAPSPALPAKGFETADFAPHGLWSNEPLLAQLDQIAGPACGFNALRVPFSCELALNLDARRPTNINYGANPQLEGMTSGALLDYLVSECAKRGIVILLDMHRMEAAGDIPELWYSAKHPESAVATAWRLMARRYAPCWNVIGADLNNEPHGCATWEAGDEGTNLKTNWRAAAERLGRVVLEANPRLLVFVEGVERCTSTGDGSWWGGHIGDAAVAPVRLPIEHKLVYSPHVYGPDVHEQVYFGSANFEQYLPKIWNEHFGFAVDPKTKRERAAPAVVPGEWGGFARAGTKDAVWQEAFARWMAGEDTSGIESSFHWCWQCNSGDTGEFCFVRCEGAFSFLRPPPPRGSILKSSSLRPSLFPLLLRLSSGGIVADDWRTLNEHKLANVRRAHPSPTAFPKLAWSAPAAAVTRADCDQGPLPGGLQDPPAPLLCGGACVIG